MVRQRELMVLAVEVGLVDRERVDELLDLAAHVAAQPGEIAGEGAGAGRRHPIGDAALDVVSLGLGEDHPGAPVEEFAQPAELLLSITAGFSHVARSGLRRGCGRSDARSRRRGTASPESARAPRERRQGVGPPTSASTSTAAAQTFGVRSRLQQRAQQRACAIGAGSCRASSHARRRTSASGSPSKLRQRTGRRPPSCAASASSAPVRTPRRRSAERQHGLHGFRRSDAAEAGEHRFAHARVGFDRQGRAEHRDGRRMRPPPRARQPSARRRCRR